MNIDEMTIAILGATSQIAKDLIISFSHKSHCKLVLFARDVSIVQEWMESTGLAKKYLVLHYDDFGDDRYSAIINFVGAGDPGKIKSIGESIFDITYKYDELALSYLRSYVECKYIFLSSGAIYNSAYEHPVGQNTDAIVPVNRFGPENWYGMAKLYTECRHRAYSYLSITDVRIYNYFSHTLDINSSFLVADMVRAIQDDDVLMTSEENIVRDYIGPDDFYQMVSRILVSERENCAVDCYTKKAIDKFSMLEAVKEQFGLKYKKVSSQLGVNASGRKINYFSNNDKAKLFGYSPSFDSLGTIVRELEEIFSRPQ